MNYKLSPSDLTYLYKGCKHCFFLKVKHGISPPSIPLPAIFSRIASLQKDYYSGMRTEEFCPNLPPGIVIHGEKWVRSVPINSPRTTSTCFINGRFDIVAELDDHSFAVLDFKTASPSDEKAEMYGRQLHAYTFSLENPANGSLHLSPVTRLGLLFFSPDRCEQINMDKQILEGELQWVEVKRDEPGFMAFLEEVVTLLDGPFPEAQPDTCSWCSYRARIGLLGKDPEQIEIYAEGLKISTPNCPTCSGPMQLKTGKYGKFWSCLQYPNCKGTQRA